MLQHRIEISLMRRAPVLAVLLLLSVTSVLRAQSTNASLAGRITDPQKALIVDAKVVVINAGTNLQYETTTNSSGEYYLANLSPNLYRIEIEKTGFKISQAGSDPARAGCNQNRL